MVFSEKIKELREEADLSQKELADRLKISQSAITKLENNLREPTGSTLIAYADYFDVSLDYLVGRDNNFKVLQNEISENEKELLVKIRKLGPIQRNTLLIMINALLAESEREYIK